MANLDLLKKDFMDKYYQEKGKNYLSKIVSGAIIKISSDVIGTNSISNESYGSSISDIVSEKLFLNDLILEDVSVEDYMLETKFDKNISLIDRFTVAVESVHRKAVSDYFDKMFEDSNEDHVVLIHNLKELESNEKDYEEVIFSPLNNEINDMISYEISNEEEIDNSDNNNENKSTEEVVNKLAEVLTEVKNKVSKEINESAKKTEIISKTLSEIKDMKDNKKEEFDKAVYSEKDKGSDNLNSEIPEENQSAGENSDTKTETPPPTEETPPVDGQNAETNPLTGEGNTESDTTETDDDIDEDSDTGEGDIETDDEDSDVTSENDPDADLSGGDTEDTTENEENDLAEGDNKKENKGVTFNINVNSNESEEGSIPINEAREYFENEEESKNIFSSDLLFKKLGSDLEDIKIEEFFPISINEANSLYNKFNLLLVFYICKIGIIYNKLNIQRDFKVDFYYRINELEKKCSDVAIIEEYRNSGDEISIHNAKLLIEKQKEGFVELERITNLLDKKYPKHYNETNVIIMKIFLEHILGDKPINIDIQLSKDMNKIDFIKYVLLTAMLSNSIKNYNLRKTKIYEFSSLEDIFLKRKNALDNFEFDKTVEVNEIVIINNIVDIIESSPYFCNYFDIAKEFNKYNEYITKSSDSELTKEEKDNIAKKVIEGISVDEDIENKEDIRDAVESIIYNKPYIGDETNNIFELTSPIIYKTLNEQSANDIVSNESEENKKSKTLDLSKLYSTTFKVLDKLGISTEEEERNSFIVQNIKEFS